MKKLIFALYDTQGYMKVLADYFGKKNFLLESHLFTRLESLVDFLREHSLDVLLLGQEVETEGLRYLEHVEHIVVMSEGDIVAEGQSCPRIFKYQSAETILAEIFQVIAQGGSELPVLARGSVSHTDFYGIYRLYGEPLAVQRFFTAQEERGLFIDLELFSGFRVGQGPDGDRECGGMSEVIFYLKQHTEKLSLKLRALIQQWEGVDYLCPVEDYRDLYSISREDVDRLLSVLSNETEYGRVVFDVGFLNDAALYLLYCCDRLYIPQARNEWEENQKNALEKLLVREGLEELLPRIRYLST